MKRNGYFTFQTVIDITGAHGTILDAVCMRGFTSHNNYLQKKVNKQVHKFFFEFSTRVGTIAH